MIVDYDKLGAAPSLEFQRLSVEQPDSRSRPTTTSFCPREALSSPSCYLRRGRKLRARSLPPGAPLPPPSPAPPFRPVLAGPAMFVPGLLHQHPGGARDQRSPDGRAAGASSVLLGPPAYAYCSATMAWSQADASPTMAGSHADASSTTAGSHADASSTTAGSHADASSTMAGSHADASSTMSGSHADASSTMAG